MTTIHGANVAPGGGTTQLPRCQLQRRPVQVHSPSTHTARGSGERGMFSARGGGGASSTATSSDAGCAERAGSGTLPPHAAIVATTTAGTSAVVDATGARTFASLAQG